MSRPASVKTPHAHTLRVSIHPCSCKDSRDAESDRANTASSNQGALRRGGQEARVVWPVDRQRIKTA